MRWVLTHPHGARCALENHPHKLTPRCAIVIGETPDVKRAARLSIYGDGYFSRIIEVLGGNYSTVKNATDAVAGDGTFNRAAREFLIKYPSRYKSVDEVGSELPLFLKIHPLSKKIPYLPDLAALDWAAHRSFYADDTQPLDPRKLQNIPENAWKNASFEFDPSVRLMTLEWPLVALWRADGKWAARQLRALKKKKTPAIVFRTPDKFVRVRPLEPAQFKLLMKLGKGQSFQKALNSIPRQASRAVGGWFNSWVAGGVFKTISFRKKTEQTK